MRTTLTIDDDLIEQMQLEARKSERSFKDVVNETLRRGLTSGARPAHRPKRFRVRPSACGFRPGIDLLKLNQLLDELEIEHAGAVVTRERRMK